MVEFDWIVSRKGIVYLDNGDSAIRIATSCGSYVPRYESCKSVVRVGQCSISIYGIEAQDACDFAKSYFAQPTQAEGVTFTGSTFTGSYAERQAQWIEHWGLKVGDKVKVVRKFESDEDGSSCVKWNTYEGKAEMQGRVCVIEEVMDTSVWLWRNGTEGNLDGFPYFALEPIA